MSVSPPASGTHILTLGPRVTMAFRLIPAGEFIMGQRGGGYTDEQPLHRVVISSPFFMGALPVTQAQFAVWTRAAGIEHENVFNRKSGHPAENMSWLEAMAFCEWLNKACAAQLPPGYRAALPTEAQWEYACRAGTDTDYWNGDGEAALAEVGWYEGNAGEKTHPAGEKPASPWGLHDMHGNVNEWCLDVYEDEVYARRTDGVVDPVVPSAGLGDARYRVLRGGSWFDVARNCCAGIRFRWGPGLCGWYLGFRVCLVPGPPAQPEMNRDGRVKLARGVGGRGTSPETEGSGGAARGGRKRAGAKAPRGAASVECGDWSPLSAMQPAASRAPQAPGTGRGATLGAGFSCLGEATPRRQASRGKSGDKSPHSKEASPRPGPGTPLLFETPMTP